MAALGDDAGPGDRRRMVSSGNHAYTCEENNLVAVVLGPDCEDSVVDSATQVRTAKHNRRGAEGMPFPISKDVAASGRARTCDPGQNFNRKSHAAQILASKCGRGVMSLTRSAADIASAARGRARHPRTAGFDDHERSDQSIAELTNHVNDRLPEQVPPCARIPNQNDSAGSRPCRRTPVARSLRLRSAAPAIQKLLAQ
jgi:hypothetical protein